MAEITSTAFLTSPLGQATTAKAEATQTATDSSSISGDFETFLTLLTTQMRNQDPLNPSDSTEFVAQLASFSAVEQQVQSNAKLDSLVAAFSGRAASGLSEWIGQQVRHEGSAEYDGRPLDVAVAIDARADQAALVVRDQNGDVVNRIQIGLQNDIAIWTGQTADGSNAEAGRYWFEVESYADGALLGTGQGAVFDTVLEARLKDGAVELVFADGSVIDANDVEAVRAAQS